MNVYMYIFVKYIYMNIFYEDGMAGYFWGLCMMRRLSSMPALLLHSLAKFCVEKAPVERKKEITLFGLNNTNDT